MSTFEPVLIVSPRYADEVAVAAATIDLSPRIERRPEKAAERFNAEPVRIVVVDARGALAPGMAAARSLGEAVEARQGAMLVLLSRGDGGATAAAHDAGATGVLVSPFGNDVFGNALKLAVRHAGRLAEAVAAPDSAETGWRRDPLTGLATGDRLEEWIADQLAPKAGNAAAPVFVLAVGVGRFAQINAAYGRVVADKVLTEVAARLGRIVDAREQQRLRGDGCLLARLAAAEFAVAASGAI
jgi:PleD family two-component response regulator